ncbi:MAG: autotransporter domain-containing protein [Peptostreptococcaceae bacterium]
MKAKEKMILLGIFLLFSSKSLVSYSNLLTKENNKDTFTIEEIGKDEVINVTTGNGKTIKDGELINNGTINSSGSNGIVVNSNGVFTNSQFGVINNHGGNGININDKNAIAINYGTINVMAGAGVNASKGSFTNSGIISVSSGKGIYLGGTEAGTIINNGEIKVTSSGIGVQISSGFMGSFINNNIINVLGGNGVDILGGTFNNLGEIKVSSGNGLNIKNGNENSINSGLINVSGGNGAYLGDGKFTNAKDMVVTGGAGVNLVKGTFENIGTINVDGSGKGIYAGGDGEGKILNTGIININLGIGAQLSGSNMIFENTGILNIKNGNGVDISGGTFNNLGEIKVSSGNGLNIKNGNENSVNNGLINVSGGNGVYLGDGKFTNAKDMVVTGGAGVNLVKGTFENTGTLIVGGSGKGIYVGEKGNGEFINKGEMHIKDGTIGVQILDKASDMIVQNEGSITIEKGVGIEISVGKFTNNGDIAVGNGIGVSLKGGSGLNEGIISNYSTGNGVKVSKGVLTNSGEIKNYGLGNAVLVSDGIFINDGGTIDGGNGIAIKSEVLRLKDPVTGKYYDAPTNNTVVLKGGKVNGDIIGGIGVDALFLQGDNNLSDISLENYEILSVTGGNSKIDNAFIDLEYNKGNQAYFDETKNKLENDGVITTDKGKLEISNSSLVIDFKNSLTDSTLENSIISADKLVLNGDISFSFISGDGRNEFNLSEAFGGVDIELGDNAKINSSVIWDYEVKDGNIIAKKNSYGEIVNTGKLSKFVNLLETDRIAKSFTEERSIDKSLLYAVSDAEQLQTTGEFTEAMKQLSGGVYGYMADIAALNSKTLSKKMLDRVIQSDFTRERATNSSTQDIIYMDNNHRINGLMDVSYKENGILGVTEKQIEENAKIGFMYGGSNGHVKFQGGEYGSASLDNIYVGGYYNYRFTDRFSLTSNARVTTAFNSLKRTINYGNTYGTFNSTFPTYGIGIGTVALYNILKNDYKFGVYGGVDWTKIVQGNITEDPRPIGKPQNELAINNSKTVDEEFYDSVVPKAGILLEKTGYLFGKKYIVGGTVEYETEMGNIKDGKSLKLQGLSQKHKIETTKMENLMSYSIFASLNVTEDFSILGSYASTKSKEYDADSLTVGGKYKFNSIGDSLDTYFDNLAGKKSDRWRGTINFLLETEDDSDRVYFDSEGGAFPGDYAASTLYIPKITMSLNDLKSKWSYYFEGYYKDNEMFQGLKSNEAEQHMTRVHLEARWGDTFSRGRYGLNIAYRNETSEKPQNFGKNNFREVKRGVHQIRLTPNFLYNLGNGFALNGNFTSIYEYNHMGDREGQGDFIMENQGGLDYTGLMPRIFMRLNYYKEDRWYDHNHPQNVERYQLSQLRPTFRYYFGNGGNVQLEARFPLGDGGYSNVTRTKEVKSESYESRYSVKYTHPIAPGLTGTIGATLLTVKTKEKSTGMETRYHSFRPMIGVGYSF